MWMDLGHFQTGLDDCSWRWPWTTILSGTGKKASKHESEKLALGWLHRNLMRCSDRQHTHPALWMQLLNFAASSHNYAMCQCHKIPKIVFCLCCSCCCCSTSSCCCCRDDDEVEELPLLQSLDLDSDWVSDLGCQLSCYLVPNINSDRKRSNLIYAHWVWAFIVSLTSRRRRQSRWQRLWLKLPLVAKLWKNAQYLSRRDFVQSRICPKIQAY